MIFTFSTRITLKRKILYIGLMIVIVSTLLITMVNFDKPNQVENLTWITTLLVSGLSLITVVIIDSNTKNAYAKWGNFVSMLLLSLVPIIISIFLYLLTIILSHEEYGEKYIILNSGWIMMINIPLVVAASYLLSIKRRKSKGSGLIDP